MNTRLFGGILLVAGTAVGAGMLVLPVVTGLAGFYPSLLLLFLTWLGTVFTALLILEVNLWFKGEVNLISMARKTLGKGAEALTWVFFLLLLYALTMAYLSGSGPLLADGLHEFFGWTLPEWSQPLPFLLIFGTVVYLGTKEVDYLNRILMIGLTVAYFVLIAWTMPHIDTELLSYAAPKYLWLAVPVVVTSFGFHIVIPSLTNYLNRDVKMLRKAIIIGSLLPLLVYVLWELVVLGVLPIEGDQGLRAALVQSSLATQPLAVLLKNPWITSIARFFSFFAIVTSFLGVTLSLASFLTDGLKIKKSHSGRLLVTLLTFIPPLIMVFIYPRSFILALQYGGVFIAIISGILPALMVWYGRPKFGQDAVYKVRGGYLALSIAILLSLIVIALQVMEGMGVFIQGELV